MEFKAFREKLFKKIESKTGWGKEQIKDAFEEVYFEMCDSKIE